MTVNTQEPTIHRLIEAVAYIERHNPRAVGKVKDSIQKTVREMVRNSRFLAAGTFGYWIERNPEVSLEFRVWVDPALEMQPTIAMEK